MLRGAIIGLGSIAVRAHLPGWLSRDEVEIVAVTDARPARRTEVEALLPRSRWYDSTAELMACEDLDFVDICTPPLSHAELIRSALERDLHVLCEKPLVCSPDDLVVMARCAASRDRVLHTVHNWHHAPIIRRTWDLVRNGAIGRVQRVVWQTLRTRPAATAEAGRKNWRVDPVVAGGGVLTDHGWHVFYLLRRWMGGEPTSISARLERRRFTELAVEDTATLRLIFPGATAEVLLTWASDARRTWAELTGTDGSIRVEDGTLVLSRRSRGRLEQRWPCPPALSDGSYHPEWFGRVADDFVAAVTDSGRRAENLAEASLCIALEALARESSRRGGRALPLSPTPLPVPISAAGSSL